MIVTLAICKLQKLQRWEVNRRVCVCVLWSREGERVKGFKGSRVQGFKGGAQSRGQPLSPRGYSTMMIISLGMAIVP